MRVILVDRCDADSIWSVMTPASKALIQDGHAVCWVRLKCASREVRCRPPEGVEVRDIDVLNDDLPFANYAQLFQFAPNFRRLLEGWKPDIVHTHFAIPGIVARKVAKKLGCKVVSTQHELFGSMNRLLQWRVKQSERYVDVVTYVSRTVAESFDRNADLLTSSDQQVSNHVVIWNHISFEEINKAIETSPPPDPNKIICVGRMVPVKGQRTLVRAWPEILKSNSNLRLLLIGSGPDESHLKSLVRDLNIEDSVFFRGWLKKSETLREIASARLAVQPSDGSQEGFGLSLGEAMACGTPVAVSNIPVFREVVGEGVEGVGFFEVGNTTALAQTCIQMLNSEATDPSAAIERVKSRYDPEQNAAHFMAVYQHVLKSNG